MSNKKNAPRSPISQERIFLITMILTVAVAAVFLVKNLMGGNARAAIIIAVCLAVFGVATFLMRKLNVAASSQIMLLCILLVVLVLLISLNSGAYYSDDFPLFLALIALTGLYLEPKCSLVQIIAIDVALIVMYAVHPEKAESMSQYIMCFAIFNVAAVLNYMVVRRGRAYIEIADLRAAEAEHLLEAVKAMGSHLQNSCSDSSQGFTGLRAANQRLEENTHNLRHSSLSVQQDSQDLAQACTEMQGCVQFTGSSLELQGEVLQNMVGIMLAGKDPMQAMHAQLRAISDTVRHTTQVFEQLQDQIRSISNLAGQLGSIAFNTKMLALNASVEAARAGQYGSGFSVVAGEVETLAANSNTCSAQVTQVVEQIKNQVNASSEQLLESFRAVETLRETLAVIDENYMGMRPNFEKLGENIDAQAGNLSSMDSLLNSLQQKISDMATDTQNNRAAAEAIVAAMNVYKAHTTRIMEDTKGLRDLSVSLIEDSAK